MPLLQKRDFQERTRNKYTGCLWQPVCARGAFFALRYKFGIIRSTRFLRCASTLKYRIFCQGAEADPAILVARATEDEFIDLWDRLGRLTAQDFRDAESAAAGDRKEMVAWLVKRARHMEMPVGTEDHAVPAADYLHDKAKLERKCAAQEQELERRNQELHEEQRKHQQLQEDVVDLVDPNRAGDPGKTAQLRPAVPSRAAENLSSHALSGSSTDPMPMPSQRPTTTGDAETEAADPVNLEGLNFVEKVLLPPYTNSLARKYWQLAAATYQEVSCNRDSKYVELEGELWSIVAEHSASNMCVIGRKVERRNGTCILELGFRGEVMEDSHGETDAANWVTNFHAAAAPLHYPNRESEDAKEEQEKEEDKQGGKEDEVQVHKGFQEAYCKINSAVLSWLRKESNIDSDAEPLDHFAVRLAGHSSGGCHALLCAVELKVEQWKIDGVVTFGSPRVGKPGFKTLYQQLELQHCTVQFANKGDMVPCFPPERSDFEHVVQNHQLGSIGVPPDPAKSHQIIGSKKSYQHTLQDAVDGREGQSVATKVANAAAKFGPAVVSKAAGAVGVGALVRPSGTSLSSVELQKLKQELRAEIALMGRSQGRLATCVIKEVEQLLRWNHMRAGLVDMRTLIDVVKTCGSELPWTHWYVDFRKALGRVLDAAWQGLDNGSEMALQCIKIYLRAASLLIPALSSAGASDRIVEEEFATFVVAASSLFCHLDPQLRSEVMQLLPGRFSLPGMPILQIQDGSSFNLDSKIRREEDLNSLWQLPEFPESLRDMPASLSLRFDLPEKKITDTLVQQLADWMIEGSTSRLSKLRKLALLFQRCDDITDASVQRLWSSLPSELTSLDLSFDLCVNITDRSLRHLFSHLSQNLAHLKLRFLSDKISGTSFKQLAEHVPLGLTSLDLDFEACGLDLDHEAPGCVGDVSLKHIAHCLRKLPRLTCLALRFFKCHLQTDELFSSLPQGLTSFAFNVYDCSLEDASLQLLFDRLHQDLPGFSKLELRLPRASQVTGAALEYLASHLPPNLNSLVLDLKVWSPPSLHQIFSTLHRDFPGLSHLELDFSDLSSITDASFHHLAEHLPQGLASLVMIFNRCHVSDVPVRQLAQKLPAGLSALTLEFGACQAITDSSVHDLALHFPSGLTSLNLGFHSCKDITNVSVQQLADSLPGLHHLTSLELNFLLSQALPGLLRDMANHLPQRRQIDVVLNGNLLEFDR